MFATATEYVLALATFGGTTRNKNNPICVAPPKMAKARTMVSVTCRYCWCYHNKLHLCKYGLMNDSVKKCCFSLLWPNSRLREFIFYVPTKNVLHKFGGFFKFQPFLFLTPCITLLNLNCFVVTFIFTDILCNGIT